MRGKMLSVCALVAILAGPTISHAQSKRKKSPSSGLSGLSALSGGLDIGQLQGMMSRAKAAQSGKGKLAQGDIGMALRLAAQMGLSPEDLAGQIQSSPAGQQALKGLSKKQIAAKIRALSQQHGGQMKYSKKPVARKQQTTFKKHGGHNQSDAIQAALKRVQQRYRNSDRLKDSTGHKNSNRATSAKSRQSR